MSIDTAMATIDIKKQALLSVVPKSLQGEMEWQHIRQSVAAALRGSEKLAKCDPLTIYTSAMYIVRLGLDIGGHEGHAFLVPFKGKCTPMIGVRGKEVLCYRSGFTDRIMSGVFHQHDRYDFDLADGSCTHKLDLTRSERGDALGAWTRVWLKGRPDPVLEVMTEGDFIKIHLQNGSQMKNPRDFKLEVTVPLEPGPNYITIIAREDARYSSQKSLVVTRPGGLDKKNSDDRHVGP